MTGTYIGLLRGINIGKFKRIAMADLRATVEALGCTNVRTLLNSGNVVFTTKKKVTGASLQKTIRENTGVDAQTTVLSAAEFENIFREFPLADVMTDATKCLCYVPASAAALEAFKPFGERSWEPEVLRIGSRAAYTWSPDGLLGGKIFEFINKTCRDDFTARNWATMSKLHAMIVGETT